MKILPSLVCIDRTGFMPGKSTDINLHRVLTHMPLPSSTSKSRVLVMLDIEKAFDSMEWAYTAAVLEVMTFGPYFRK